MNTEQLYFYKGLEANLPTSSIKKGALYHCTDTKNTYIGTGDKTMELWASGAYHKRIDGGIESDGNKASGISSHAEGIQTTAVGDYSHAEGYSANSFDDVAENAGFDEAFTLWYDSGNRDFAIALGYGSHVEGNDCFAGDGYAHAEGRSTLAKGHASHAEGYWTEAIDAYAHAEGCQTQAHGGNSHAEGNQTEAYGSHSHTEGNKTSTKDGLRRDLNGNYLNSSAEIVDKSQAVQSTRAHAEGDRTKALGEGAHSEGIQTESYGCASHAEGAASKTYGGGSHAEGTSTQAIGKYSHAEGQLSTSGYWKKVNKQYVDNKGNVLEDQENDILSRATVGLGTHAEGGNTHAVNNFAHSEGVETTAFGSNSHAEGHSDNLAVDVIDNFSSGQGNAYLSNQWNSSGRNFSISVGTGSHVEGHNTYAGGKYSHAEGEGTIAYSNNQHVEGKYNVADTANKYIHIAGKGDATTPSNAYTLDWDGNAEFAGGVTAVSGAFDSVDVNGDIEIQGNLTVLGATTLGDTEDPVTIAGDLTVDGDIVYGNTATSLTSTITTLNTTVSNHDTEIITIYEDIKEVNELVNATGTTAKNYTDGKITEIKDYIDGEITTVENTIQTTVANLVNSAPEALDTLNELANALGDDPNFATTVATEIGKKVETDSDASLKSLSVEDDITLPLKNKNFNSNSLKTEMGTLLQNTTSNTASIVTLNTTVSGHTGSIATINQNLTNKIDKDSDASLKSLTVESDITLPGTNNSTISLKGTIKDLLQNTATNTRDITDIGTTVAGHTTSIGTLNTTVSNHTTSIGTLNQELNKKVDKDSDASLKSATITNDLTVQGNIETAEASVDGTLTAYEAEIEENLLVKGETTLEGPLEVKNTITTTMGLITNELLTSASEIKVGSGFRQVDLSVPNGDIYVRGKKVVTNQSDNDSTVIIGNGTSIGNNTVVIGQKSNAVSDDAIAIGHNVTAGCRGFYWTSINGTTLQLSTSQNKNAWEKKDGLDPSEQLDHWNEGDVISFNNDTRYVLKSTITDIDYTNHTITFDELPFEEKVFIADPSYEDFAIINPRKPNHGVISFAPGSFVAGLNNSATGRASVALNENNIAAGNWSFAEGSDTIASGTSSHAEGWLTLSANLGAHAEGVETIASGARSHAEGYKTQAIGSNSHAEGSDNYAIGVGSHVEGNPFSQTVKLTGPTNINTDTYIYSSGQPQIDDYFIVDNIYSTITEVDTSTKQITVSHPLTDVTINNKEFTKYRPNCSYGVGSHAEGRGTYAEGNGAHAEGQNTIALAHGSHAEGASTTASGVYAHAEGGTTTASGTRAHAEGHETLADGFNAHAEGNYVKASGISAHAEGGYYKGYSGISDDEPVTLDGVSIKGSVATGDFSHAEGRQTYAKGNSSHTEGFKTLAKGNYAHAEGLQTFATYQGAHAEGSNTTASGECSHAEGYKTVASGQYSHVEGKSTPHNITVTGGRNVTIYTVTDSDISNLAINDWFNVNNTIIYITAINTTNKTITVSQTLSGTALNSYTIARYRGGLAKGNYSHAEGSNTNASGKSSHAEGNNTTASGEYSHAEGDSTEASGKLSHAEGYDTTASGTYSHAEGYRTQAIKNYTHAEGRSTIANADDAHVEGRNTVATFNNQHVQGKYNYLDENGHSGDYAHVVGWGTSTTPKNIHTLSTGGTGWFAGGITADGTDGLKIGKNGTAHYFTVNGSNGNTSVGGTLTVTGATTLKGNVTLGDSTNSTSGDTLTVNTKLATFNGALTVAGKTTLNGGLVLDADTYGTDNLSTKTGTKGQIYFKKV